MANGQKTQMQDEAPPNHEPLSFIQPRETLRVIKARSERRLVEKLRIGLPLTAVIVLAALFIWPAVRKTDIKHAVMKNIPDLVIQNLHFTGTDTKNEPYSLMATKATRAAGLINIYDLDQQLWLGGDVQLFHDKGYQFTTDEAQVSLGDNDAWGEKPVLIQGDFGQIRGQGFRMLDSGTVMVIKGPATASLRLRPSPASDKPTATKE
jgi:lipopolysaccharide export system protein LptC